MLHTPPLSHRRWLQQTLFDAAASALDADNIVALTPVIMASKRANASLIDRFIIHLVEECW